MVGKIRIGTGEYVECQGPGLRPGTKFEKSEINLVYAQGGMGDFIHWTTVMDWVYSEHEHLFGSVLAPRYFYELSAHWLKHLSPRVEVRAYDNLEKDKFYRRRDKYFLYPNDHQLTNAMGSHLLDIGFRYYANLDEVPDGYARLPVIHGDEREIAHLGLPSDYVVVTTEATSPIRKLRASTINGINKWLNENGYQVVFLGKRELEGNYKSSADDGLEMATVLDLREKTSPLEAACVLANAKAVMGLDNGLLHLASCSKVPVVFGFNTVDPRQRISPRQQGAKTITVTPGEHLPCRFCQSRVRFFVGHSFHNCVYGDSLCLDLLDSALFIKALEKVLD